MAPRNTTPIVRYKTLIEQANCRGLVSISTELVQIPTPDNNNTAIARACVTFDEDGRTRSFEDYGDANPGNVGPMVAGALIRMAITRAKARCLRDALGVGDVAAEELPDYSDNEDRPTRAINSTGAQCPKCHAPAGKPHVKPCV